MSSLLTSPDISLRLSAICKIGTISKTDPLAIQKNCFFSFLCQRPLPSAKFNGTDIEALLN
jgi:hypothetical protein